jgi:hypothetical protein
MPAHYKKILEIAKYLDVSINFIKKCRSNIGSGSSNKALTFEELKTSVEKTYGR